jgi:hypothetical protein
LGNVLQVIENSPRVEPIEVQVQEPIAQAAKNSPGVKVDRVPEAIEVQAQEAPLESKFGRIVYPQPAQKAIAPATKSLDVEVDRVDKAIAQAPGTSPAVEVDRVPEPIEYPRNSRRDCLCCGGIQSLYQCRNFILESWVIRCLYCDYERLKDPRCAYLAAPEPVHGPDEYPWKKEAILQAIAYPPPPPGYTPTRDHCSPLLPIAPSTQAFSGVDSSQEPIAQNATTRLELPRNESADVRYERSHPAQPDGNYSNTETVGLGNQEGDRVLEVAGNFQADRGRVIPHQPTQLSESGDGRVGYLELEIGMLVGRRRDRHHLGKILAIYKSRRGIWRAKIQPLNKSNFVYFDCAALIEQRLLYDYEIKPGGFLPSGSTFDKTRGEKFEVYSRKVRSPKLTNWTAGELSSLSTFNLKQIARDMEIPSIPGTAGKRSLIIAILAEQAISQEKAAAQRERETGRAIVQKQKPRPTAGKKKRAGASPGTQLSLFDVAV